MDETMKVFCVFAPAFHVWPLEVMGEIAARVERVRLSGLIIGRPSVVEFVRQHAKELGDVTLDGLDDLEREWLAAEADEARLAEFEEMLGVAEVRKIVTADRQVGHGLISGGTYPVTELVRRCRRPEMIRRYVCGLLEYVFERLTRDRPDVVFCYGVAGAPAMALGIVSRHLGIPLLTLSHTRIGNRYLLEEWTQGSFQSVARRFHDALRSPAALEPWDAEAREYLAYFRTSLNAPDYVRFSRARQRRELSLPSLLRATVYSVLAEVQWSLRGQRRDLRLPPPLGRLRHQLGARLRARRLMGNGTFRAPQDLPKGPFAYFPLHMDPEASTMVLAPMLTNQIAVAEALAKSLPMSMELVVKEHQPMVGLRPPGFYDQIARLPGVRLMSPLADGPELVRRAALTATITGTAAWEALLLGRPALTLGEVPMSVLGEGLVQCGDLTALPQAVSRALDTPPASEERLVLLIAAILAESFEFPTELFWGKVTLDLARRNAHITHEITGRVIAAARSQQASGAPPAAALK